MRLAFRLPIAFIRGHTHSQKRSASTLLAAEGSTSHFPYRLYAYSAAGLILAFAFVMATRLSVAADAVRGQQLYVECIACHSLEPGVHGIGPSLHGVFNRQAGVVDGFRYSPALRRSGIIWTADTLDAFIADSQKFLAGNRMPFAGMPEAADRADLIAYLQQAAQ